jgi:hypothetical protein
MSESTGTPIPSPRPLTSPGERALLARLEALEKTEERLKRQSLLNLVGLAVLLGGAAAMFFFAARRGMPGSVAAVVESREYRLRDQDGRIRGAWGFAEDGAIRFVLQNGDNQRALRLNLLPDGSAGVTFADSAGANRVVLGLLSDGTASLVFADGKGASRSVYSFSPSGASSVIFADRSGVTRSGLGVDSRGRALFAGDAAVAPPAEEEPTPDSAAVPSDTKRR